MNERYLAAGLTWLRARLSGGGQPVSENPGGESPDWWNAADPPDGDPPALEVLAARFGLSRFEVLLLLLCAAMELDPAMPACCAEANGDPTAGYPTFGLALRCLPEPAWDVVSPHRPLRSWRLLEVHQPGGQPLIGSRLRADERVVNFIKGLNELDERLAFHLRAVPDVFRGVVPASHQRLVDQVTEVWAKARPRDGFPVVELVGPDPEVRRGLAYEAVHPTGLELLELLTGRLPPVAADHAELLRLWDREMMLRPLALYVEVGELHPDRAPAVTAFLEGATGLVIAGGREPWPLTDRRVRVLDADRPTAQEQDRLWGERLGPGGQALAGRLAGQFDLHQAAIAQVCQEVDGADPGRVWRTCQALTRPRLDGLARCIEPAIGWDDLVLPAEQLTLLRHLVDQVRGRATVFHRWGFADRIGRGTGSTALFAGPSGTGKTLAAEVIAGELDLSLYRVDLSGVVSKYIGETERNLRRVFDAAEEGGALLLFDEADALFGRRSEVRDSHDRYANIEVNYLLQRMEDYRGIAILATNQRAALDQAFLRRLRLVVTFPHPARPERAALWTRALPEGTPAVGIDVQRLAELPATGGMIRNIAVNAACCAAGRDAAVTMDLLAEMARVEFRKLDLPVNDDDFAWAGTAAP